MKKAPYYLLLLALLFTACSNPYGTVEKHTLTASTNGTTYELQVVKPYSYDTSINYPTVYILDGDTSIGTISTILADLSDQNLIQDVVVVAVGYGGALKGLNERIYDYMYPEDTTGVYGHTGGGELFHTFMRNEVVPFIEARYSCDTQERTIVGHSAGGFFALYSLFHHYILGSTPFQNFVALDPGIHWADAYILGEELATNAATNDLNATLYMSRSTLSGAIVSVPFQAMKDQITTSTYNNFAFTTSTFDLSHMSMVSPSLEESMLYLFSK